MLKLRNLSLIRRLYVWALSLITRLAYTPLQRLSPSDSDVHPTAARIRRINSELTDGPGEWQKEFLHSTGYLTNPQAHHVFELSDIAFFLTDGIEALTNDTLSRCFTEQPPHPWNFLTRNIPPGPWKMTPYQSLLWAVGFWARYCVFLPFRLFVLFVGAIPFLIGWPIAYILPSDKRKRALRQWLLRYLASVVVSSWSGYIKFHGKRPQRRAKQIYVANHASLIDLFILNKDYHFSCIGQRHKGLAGFLQDLLICAQDHVWFDREEGNDRRAVQLLLKNHVEDGTKEPMLVFPEGTCTHSQYCVMFKKGSFELGVTVYPIALKYRHHYGDPFWNSQRVSFARHLVDIMTSWSVVCDVYYLEPQTKRDDETAVDFANRVKRMICEKAGLISMNWDGFLKRHRISPKFLDARQRALASVLTRRMNGELPRAASASVLLIDGVIQQTAVFGISGEAASELDSLYYDRKLTSNHDAATSTPVSIYREVLALGRRSRRAPPRPFTNPTVRFFANLVHHAVRWGVGMGMVIIAAIVTKRFMPESWKQVLRSPFSAFLG